MSAVAKRFPRGMPAAAERYLPASADIELIPVHILDHKIPADPDGAVVSDNYLCFIHDALFLFCNIVIKRRADSISCRKEVLSVLRVVTALNNTARIADSGCKCGGSSKNTAANLTMRLFPNLGRLDVLKRFPDEKNTCGSRHDQSSYD